MPSQCSVSVRCAEAQQEQKVGEEMGARCPDVPVVVELGVQIAQQMVDHDGAERHLNEKHGGEVKCNELCAVCVKSDSLGHDEKKIEDAVLAQPDEAAPKGAEALAKRPEAKSSSTRARSRRIMR